MTRENLFVVKKIRDFYKEQGITKRADLLSAIRTGCDTEGVHLAKNWTFINEYSARQLFKHLKEEKRQIK